MFHNGLWLLYFMCVNIIHLKIQTNNFGYCASFEIKVMNPNIIVVCMTLLQVFGLNFVL